MSNLSSLQCVEIGGVEAGSWPSEDRKQNLDDSRYTGRLIVVPKLLMKVTAASARIAAVMATTIIVFPLCPAVIQQATV